MAATTAKPVKSAGKIPGSTLKIIAMVCMLIDHTAAVLFDRILISRDHGTTTKTRQPFRPLCYEPWRFGDRLADARQTPIV